MNNFICAESFLKINDETIKRVYFHENICHRGYIWRFDIVIKVIISTLLLASTN